MSERKVIVFSCNFHAMNVFQMIKFLRVGVGSAVLAALPLSYKVRAATFEALNICLGCDRPTSQCKCDCPIPEIDPCEEAEPPKLRPGSQPKPELVKAKEVCPDEFPDECPEEYENICPEECLESKLEAKPQPAAQPIRRFVKISEVCLGLC
jgi:hypothetical protein